MNAALICRHAHSSKRSCLVAAGGAPRVGQPGWACWHARQPSTRQHCVVRVAEGWVEVLWYGSLGMRAVVIR